MSKKRIFTFWEPRKNIHGYISLCMRTWKIFHPDYEVVVLDWQNLDRYLTPNEIGAVLCKEMTLAKQSDCLRCAILLKYGGIWMDADTILTHRIDTLLNREGCLFIGRQEVGRRMNHGAFIVANAPGSQFLLSWYSSLLPRICEARRYRLNPLLRVFCRSKWRKIRRWDYCVNAIIDPLCNEQGERLGYQFVDKDDIGAMPEFRLRRNPRFAALSAAQLYRKYWFEKPEAEVEGGSGGVVLLHNSWTPKSFRDMSEDEFLSCNVRMACLLRQILKANVKEVRT